MAKQIKVASKSNARANATSLSWENDKTRAARLQKDAVTVTFTGSRPGYSSPAVSFGSVRKAFTAYRLPDAKHREFRATLKKTFNGTAVFEHKGLRYEFKIVGFPVATAANVVNAVTTEVSKKKPFVFPTADSVKEALRIKEGMTVARIENPGFPVGVVRRVTGDFASVLLAEGLVAINVTHLVECAAPMPGQLACDFTKSLPFSSLPLLAAFQTVTSDGFDFHNSYLKVGNSTAIRVPEVSVQGGALYAKLESPSPVEKARFKKDHPVFPLYVKAAQ